MAALRETSSQPVELDRVPVSCPSCGAAQQVIIWSNAAHINPGQLAEYTTCSNCGTGFTVEYLIAASRVSGVY